MDARMSIVVASLSLGIGCGGDDGGGGGTGNGTTMPASSTMTTAGDDGATTTGGTPTTTSNDPATSGSSSGMADSTDTGGAELTGFLDSDGPACETNVQGEWNACVDENGAVMTTLCNYLGDSDANGFIGCLNSSEMDGANTCFINGCVDVCDCLPPPSTGTAVVVCDAILDSGENGCALDCSGGATCPDGMDCIGTICFWPPA